MILAISHFRFEGKTLVLIVPVPGHCLPFEFVFYFHLHLYMFIFHLSNAYKEQYRDFTPKLYLQFCKVHWDYQYHITGYQTIACIIPKES